MKTNTETTAHTDGPWTVSGPGPYDTQSRVTLTVEQDSPTRRQVALVGNAPATMTREEAEANARLIALAPDLLDCCKAALHLLNDPDDAMGDKATTSMILEAVIAKACGGDA